MDMLSPFTSNLDGSCDVRLEFHNAVMRWKCLHLTDEERYEVQVFIHERAQKKEGVIQYTDDELSKENENIQRYTLLSPPSTAPQTHVTSSSVDALPATMHKALEQIEKSTGMKAIVLIGGPAPAGNGDFSTYW